MRAWASARVIQSACEGLSRAGRLHPLARPALHGVEVFRDVPYAPVRGIGAPVRTGGHHRLDIYRPRERLPGERLPVVLYVHGGGFHMLSKDSHWIMALAFARMGFVVATIDYRLAPRHPYPAAITDACLALRWVHQNIDSYGGDPARIVLSGESAGGNLVCALAVASSYRRPEPYARAVWDQGVRPAAVIPACGILQVTDTGRIGRRKSLNPFVDDYIKYVARTYLGRPNRPLPASDMASPLLIVERTAPDRPLPPFFAYVGTRDPLLDDTRRLASAVQRHGSVCEVRYYPGGVHAFQVLLWQGRARQAWRDQYAFLREHVLTTSEVRPLPDLRAVVAGAG